MIFQHSGFRLYGFLFLVVVSTARINVCYAAPNSHFLHQDSLISLKIKQARFNEAIAMITALIHEKQSPEDLILLKLRLCEAYWSSANITELQKHISKITIPGTSSALIQFRFYLTKGRALVLMGNYTAGLALLKEAEQRIPHLPKNNTGEAIELFLELGKTYTNHSNLLPAKIYFQKASELLKKSNHLITEKMFCNAALAYISNDKTRLNSDSLIQVCYNYALSKEKKSDPEMLPLYLQMISYFIYIELESRKAEMLMHRATDIINQYYSQDHYYAGLLYNYKCFVKYDEGDYENALNYGKLATEISEKYPSFLSYNEKSCLILASIYLWYYKDYARALEYCRKITNNPASTAYSVNYANYIIGLSEVWMENFTKGKQILLGILQKGEPEDASTARTFIYCYLELSNLSFYSNTKLTSYYLNKALDLAYKFNIREEIAKIHLQIARIYYSLENDYEKALMEYQESIIAGCRNFTDKRPQFNPSVNDILEPYLLTKIFSYKAYLFYLLHSKNPANLENLKTALECQELSVKIYEKLLWGIQEENAGLGISDMNVINLNNAVSYAVLLYLKTKDPFYAEKALIYSEKSKMQLLLINSVKQENLLKAGVPDAILQEERRIKNEILELENTLTLTEKSGMQGYYNSYQKIAHLYDQRDAFMRQLEHDYPKYYKAKYDYHVAGLSEIRKDLKNDEVLLEYQLLNTELITFVITRQALRIHYQKIDPVFQEKIEKLYQAVSTSPDANTYMASYNEFISSSTYLYQKLIAPVYPYLKEKHLVIIPHNKLNLVPFEVLLSASGSKNQADYKNLPYLIKEFPISYAYSANLRMQKSRSGKAGRGTAVFLPDYKSWKNDGQFYTLKGAESEAKTICRLSNGQIFEGIEASEKSFKKYADNFGVIHIASHAIMDDTIPKFSGVIMSYTSDTSDDGHLYAYEISQLALNAQMVVLNGCNTGNGALRKNEGLISLARSFFSAGARTVAYSLWPVSDQSGSVLVSDFYRKLNRNKQLDDALRETKLSFIENTDPVKAHPYYWANFMIVGKTDSIMLHKHPFWLKTLILIFISGISVGIIYKFRTNA